MSRKLFEELAKRHLILYFNGHLVVTNKFLRLFKSPPLPETNTDRDTPITVPEKVAQRPLTPEECFPVKQTPNLPAISEELTPVAPFLKFIKDCEVPEKVTTRTGSYWANKYSKKAEQEFFKILKGGYQMDILIASTKLYYKSGGQPKAISNYILEGTWLSFYQDMQTSLQDGKVNEHINKNLDKTDEDGYSRYKR